MTTYTAEREAARKPDGKFGHHATSGSAATLDAERQRVYQQWEDELGEDLYGYVHRVAEGMYHRRERNIDSMHRGEDVAQEIFIQIQNKINEQAESGVDQARNKQSIIRGIANHRTQRINMHKYHWGNNKAATILDKKVEDYTAEHHEQPSRIQYEKLKEQTLKEVSSGSELNSSNPAQRDFDELRKITQRSIDAPLTPGDESSTTLAQTLDTGDAAPEASPEEAIISGDSETQSAISATCESMGARMLSERARGSREAMSHLMPEHPIEANSLDSKGLRNLRRRVKGKNVRDAMLDGIEAAKHGEPDTSATQAAFSPWASEDAETREEIVDRLDELTGGDEEKFRSLWDRAVEAQLTVDDEQ